MATSTISLNEIITDSRCQSRTGIDRSLVQEYVEAIQEGAALPPLSTIRASEGHYLYDGFHRLQAYQFAGKKQVDVDYDDGDVWEAMDRSCCANATHGKRRTVEDTKRAIKTAMEVLSHRGEAVNNITIAKRCNVSPQYVSRVIKADPSLTKVKEGIGTTVTRNGKTFPVDTSNMGRPPKQEVPTWRAPKPPTIDNDTGEILDDDPEIEPEYVSTADHQSFLPDPPPAPSPKPSPNGTAAATVSRAESIASRLVKELGRSLALEVADQIYEIADE